MADADSTEGVTDVLVRPIRIETSRPIKIRWAWATVRSKFLGEEFHDDECDQHVRGLFQATMQFVAEEGLEGVLTNAVKYPMKKRKGLGELIAKKKRLFFFRAGGFLLITNGHTKRAKETDPAALDKAEEIRDARQDWSELATRAWGAHL